VLLLWLRLRLRSDRARRYLTHSTLPDVGLALREGCAPGAPLANGLRCGLRRSSARLEGIPRLRLLRLLLALRLLVLL